MATLEEITPSLADFSREISRLNLIPLWERKPGSMAPGTPCIAEIWRWQDLRPHLIRATELISKRDAERRVLVMENPSLRGTTYITNTLYAGLQVIKPGEIAPSHRHTPNALRFVMEGEGAYTCVNGERVAMHPGDFVVTPNWQWHDHGNTGTDTVVWLDGLDTPIGKLFGTMFREDHADESQVIDRQEGESLASFGATMAPETFMTATSESPILLYPYARTREALATLQCAGRLDLAQGVKLRYINPTNGSYPFRTMAVFMQLMPKGFSGQPYRSTDGAVFVAAEGKGSVTVGDQRINFGPKDVFVIPSWNSYRFEAEEEVVLFSYSDRAAQQALGLWEEERVANG
jgi:gentisate 1,2-dioxygenase